MLSIKSQTLQEPICDTCLSKLGDAPFRKLVLKDKKGFPLILCIHYFSPCWDLDLLHEKYSEYELVYAGFSLNPKSILKKPKTIRNLQNNYDLW